MKYLRIIFYLTISMIWASGVRAQQSYGDSLKKHCVIDTSAQFIIDEVGKGVDTIILKEVRREMAGDEADGLLSRIYLPIPTTHYIASKNVANDIWLLMANNIYHLGSQTLTVSGRNFIPTTNAKNKPTLLIITWNQIIQKWLIIAVPMKGLRKNQKFKDTLAVGERIFKKY